MHPWLLIALVCSWVPTPGSPEIFTSCSLGYCRVPSDGSRDVFWVPHFCAAAESYMNNLWRLISASPLRRCCTARRTCCSTSAPSSKHGHTGLRCRAWPGLRSTPQPWTLLDWAAAGGHRSGHWGGPHAQDRLRPSNGAGCRCTQAAPAARALCRRRGDGAWHKGCGYSRHKCCGYSWQCVRSRPAGSQATLRAHLGLLLPNWMEGCATMDSSLI